MRMLLKPRTGAREVGIVMQTVLQVLGVLFLVLVVLLIVAYILIRIFVWRLGRRLKQVLSEGHVSAPPRITLVPEDEPAWENERAARRFLAPLSGLGFHEAGLWGAEEMPGLHLAAFVHPAENIYAAVYEHRAVGVVLDMVTRYVDGTGITFTTAERVAHLDEWPGHPKVCVPNADSTALFRRAIEERPDGEMLPAVASEFREVFERAYADEMDWRLSRGGATEEEIRRIALASGEDYSDEEYASALRLQQHEAIANLNYALRERFAEETTLSVAEWERVSGALVFIHDDLRPDVLRDILEAWFCEDADEYVWREELPPRQRFANVVAQIPQERRPERLGEVAEPAAADVYTPNREYVSDYDEEDEW